MRCKVNFEVIFGIYKGDVKFGDGVVESFYVKDYKY